MSEKVIFKYFEGRDAEQFTFYRIPKQLFTVEYFKGLSSDAKILYGLMLDRVTLSVKNQWFDEKNRAYIYFSIDEVMELLGCGRNKAVKCMKELDEETGIGLTRKRRQGFGKSNMIYVKTFLVQEPAEMRQGNQARSGGGAASTAAKKQTSVKEDADVSVIGQTSVSGNQQPGEENISKGNAVFIIPNGLYETKDPGKRHDFQKKGPDYESLSGIPVKNETAVKFENQTNGGSGSVQEVYISNFMKSQKQTSGSPENKLQEVYFWDPNKNNYNKTEDSDIKSYRILSGDTLSFSGQEDDGMRYNQGQAENWSRGQSIVQETGNAGQHQGAGSITDDVGYIYDLVRKNIGLEDLLTARNSDKDLILEIYSLIVEMITCRSTEIVVASCRYPAEIVRSRFLKLRYDHVIYVMDCMEKNTSKVKNIRKYLLTAFFNAPATMDSYYRAEVRHDMAENVYSAGL